MTIIKYFFWLIFYIYKVISCIMAQIGFDPCVGNWISVCGASDLSALCLCWWSKLSVCLFWSNEESISTSLSSLLYEGVLLFFDQSWSPETSPLISLVLCFQWFISLKGASTSIALVSRVPLMFYTFVRVVKLLMGFIAHVVSILSITAAIMNTSALTSLWKESWFSCNTARHFSCDSKKINISNAILLLLRAGSLKM